MKKSIIVFIFFVFGCLFLSPNVNASTEDLTFTLLEIVDGGEWKNVKIQVTNNTTATYAYGWCSDTAVTFYNDYNENETVGISGWDRINPGTSNVVLNVNLRGIIKKITIDGPIRLSSNGLPTSKSGESYTCGGLSNYVLKDSSLETDFSIKLTKLEDDGITKHAYITVINNSKERYRVGFMEPSVTFINVLGKRKTVNIASHQNTIFDCNSVTKFDFYVELEDRISAIIFNDVGKLQPNNDLVIRGSEFDCYASLIYANILNTEDLFKVSAVQKDESNGVITSIKLVFENNTENDYAISGWSMKSQVTFVLASGKCVSYYINENVGIKVLSGNKTTYNLKVNIDEDIKGMAIDKILQLKNGLPIDVGGTGFRKNISLSFSNDNYKNYEQNGLSYNLKKIVKKDGNIINLVLVPKITSSNSFQYGTASNAAILIIKNSAGDDIQYKLDIFKAIVSGEEYSITTYISGNITNLEIRNIYIEDNRGLPINNSNFDLNIQMNSYEIEDLSVVDSYPSNNSSNNGSSIEKKDDFSIYLPFIGIAAIVIIVIIIAKRRKN